MPNFWTNMDKPWQTMTNPCTKWHPLVNWHINSINYRSISISTKKNSRCFSYLHQLSDFMWRPHHVEMCTWPLQWHKNLSFDLLYRSRPVKSWSILDRTLPKLAHGPVKSNQCFCKLVFAIIWYLHFLQTRRIPRRLDGSILKIYPLAISGWFNT